MARCPHINRAPIYDLCYDKKIYSLYLYSELSVFCLSNSVEIRNFVYPVKFLNFFSSFKVRLFSIMLQ